MSFKTLSHIFSPFKNIASSPLVVAMLLYAFYCDTALGKIGETQDAMIQRCAAENCQAYNQLTVIFWGVRWLL
jgi:hypothetical protein